MDTISRDNNSMLPIGGIIVGVIALALGLYSAVSLSKIKNQVAQQQEKIATIDDIASQASAASAAASKAQSSIDNIVNETNAGFKEVSSLIGTMQGQISNLEKGGHRVGAKGGAHGEAVAGPGEYIVKSGDTGRRIARANGCSLADLEAVNPGVDWSKIHPGQKLKLPEKRASSSDAAPAPAPAPSSP